MKLKYIFTSLVAALALFTSCDDDKTLDGLDNIQVSQSIVSLPADGGSADIQVSATDFDINIVNSKDKPVQVGDKEYPDWLTISKSQDKDGKTVLNFTATKATASREAYLFLVKDDQKQRIRVIQQTAKVDRPLSTCKQVLEGPDGDTYKVKGSVTKIANTTYGNLYVNDGTGEVYIYGTLDANGGEKNFLSLGIEVGDEITVEGPKETYNGTVELKNVTVLSIKKSILKFNALSVESLPKEGGEVVAELENKGDGLTIDIPADAEDWLSVKSIAKDGDLTLVTFKATANNGGARTATVSFSSSNGKTSSTITADIAQEGAIAEVTASEFLAAAEGTAIYRLTGVVTKIASADYGNIYIQDYTGEVYVYGIGSKGDFKNLNVKVGDVITLTGMRSAYKGTPQVKGGTYESHKTVKKVSVAEFLALPEDKNAWYMLTGKIATAAGGNKTDVATYGNFDLQDETGSVYIYGVQTGWENTPNLSKKHFGDLGKGLGDEITVIGYRTAYKNVAQMGGGFFFEEKK